MPKISTSGDLPEVVPYWRVVFANECHDENGRFCEGGSSGSGSGSGDVAPVLSAKEQKNRDQIRREILDARAEDGKKPLSEASLNVYVIKEAGKRAAAERAAGSEGAERTPEHQAAVDQFNNAVSKFGGNLGLFKGALTIKDSSWDDKSGREFKVRVEQHLQDLSKIPAPLISKFVAAGGKVVVGNGSITDLHMPELAGIQPRGWPSGTTYSNVAGVFDPRTSTVVLGNVERGVGSGSVSHFALHEFAHGLDSLTTKVALESGKDDFKTLHVEFVNGARGHMNDYYIQAGGAPGAGLSETFADVGRGWLLGFQKAGVGARDMRGAILRNTFAEAATFVSADVSAKMISYMDKKFGTAGVRARKVA